MLFVKKVLAIGGLLVFLLVLTTAWQVASCEFANYELKDDLHDVAALGASQMAFFAEQSDEDLRTTVMEKAAGHDIRLRRDQIIVRRMGTKEKPKIFLAARYQSRVRAPGFSIVFHFVATSR